MKSSEGMTKIPCSCLYTKYETTSVMMVATVPNSLLIIGFAIQKKLHVEMRSKSDANPSDYKVLNQWFSF